MKCTVSQEDRIVGERFEKLCDIVYKHGHTLPSETGTYIVFSKTDYVLGLLGECGKNMQNKYIIVTHHSDYPIDNRIFAAAPNNIVKWFGINVTYDHPTLESIPLGSASSTWIGTTDLAEVKTSPEFMIIEEDGVDKDFKNLVYLDFGIHTNPNHRREVYDYFKNNDWVTPKPCDIPLSEYEKSSHFNKIGEYYQNLYNHKYVVSPLGNGVDCGRVWQAIYLGTIPIIPRHLNINFYLDLPILVYDKLSDITEDFLTQQYEKILKTSSLDKSTMSYWATRLKNEKNKWSF
tara:strand:- start:562 stop:1431 length:870 start_codon:yes stop_codon:yes gene_type:complete